MATLNAADALTLLETHCLKCHGGEKTKAGLDLTTREAMLRGGDSGNAIIPGNPDGSLLMQMVRHEKDPGMPQKEKKLPEAEIAELALWIKEGAAYNRALNKSNSVSEEKTTTDFSAKEAGRLHWSFQPVMRPVPPSVNSRSSAINPIDLFVLAKLEKKGLCLAPPADRETLIRRVTYDLIGLPPAPEEIDRFLNDTAPNAYEKLVERLLDSPHYGERWGRHWLDLARYGETDGFEHDAVRPHSWRYRDYVIRSFNNDKPYDRFIREQIAGDELWPEDPEALIATGFNLLGPDMVDSSDQEQRRHNTLNDITDTTALAFLGLTLGCARCHDHKFEPLSQRDYYSFQAFFAKAAFRREQEIATAAERSSHELARAEFEQNPKVRALAEIEIPARAKLRQNKFAKLAPEAQAAHAVASAQRTAEQSNLVLETEPTLAVSEKELVDALNPEEAKLRVRLIGEINRLPKTRPLPKAMALGKNSGPPVKTFILQRGEYSRPKEEVEPAFPTVLARSTGLETKENQRAELANWLASTANPLTARVMVNRIWQHHFGRGLVSTPSDFGVRGAAPTHPELLDWLAGEFMDRGWSLKQLHRLIMLSATYRQSSHPENNWVKSHLADPGNALYWRMNPQRLEGEIIRDSLLTISGQLNPQIGGPGVFPPIPEAVQKGAPGWLTDSRAQSRRSVYIFARRNLRFPFLEVFDAPDSNLSCPARERSTTAPQALMLLNAEEVMTAANLTARRVSHPDDETIARLFRLALGRSPAPRELAMTREFLNRSPLNELCRALFNLNDFVYIQ